MFFVVLTITGFIASIIFGVKYLKERDFDSLFFALCLFAISIANSFWIDF